MTSKQDLPLEKDFQRAVLKKLRDISGSWWVKINDRVTVGLPDLIGCVSGVFVAIELKTKTKVTALQAHTLRRITRSGGQAFVVNPDNWNEVYALILKIAALGGPESP